MSNAAKTGRETAWAGRDSKTPCSETPNVATEEKRAVDVSPVVAEGRRNGADCRNVVKGYPFAASGEHRAAAERFLRFLRVEEATGCLVWSGAQQSRGYGSFGFGGKGRTVLAHRFAYELHVGWVGPELQVDHACKNRLCVNPAHLQAVLPAENNRRSDSPTARNGRATHCVYGHALEGDNVIVRRDGRRRCRACGQRDHRESGKAAYWRAKAEALEAQLKAVRP